MQIKGMEFKEIKTKQKREDFIKISFRSIYVSRKTQQKVGRIYIYVGVKIISELKWQTEDYIRVFRSKHDDKFDVITLMKRKEDEDDEYKRFKGFKIRKMRGSYSYLLSFVWDDQDEISEEINGKVRPPRSIPFEIVPDKDGDYLKVFYANNKIEEK